MPPPPPPCENAFPSSHLSPALGPGPSALAGVGTHAGQREAQVGHIQALLHGHSHAVGQHQVGSDEVLQQAV